MAQALDIAVTPWGAMGGGVLSGKYASGTRSQYDRQQTREGQSGAIERKKSRHRCRGREDRRRDRAPLDAGCACLVASSDGCDHSDHRRTHRRAVVDNLGVVSTWKLLNEHLARLDEVSRVPLAFPAEFLRNRASFAEACTVIAQTSSTITARLVESLRAISAGHEDPDSVGHDEATSLTLDLAVPAVEAAFRAHGLGRAQMPPKVYLSLESVGGDFRAMPSFLDGAAGVKWVIFRTRTTQRDTTCPR